MAVAESTKTPVLSQLSADSVSFVPAHSRQNVLMDNYDHRTGSINVPMPTMIPQTANYLPSYVMSCYPYTDTDVNARFQANGMSVATGHADLQGKPIQSHVLPKLSNPIGNNFQVDGHCLPQMNSVVPPPFLPPSVVNPSLQVPFVNPLSLPAQSSPAYVQGPLVGSVPPPPPHGYVGLPSALYGYNPSLQFMHGMQFPGYLYSAAPQSQGVWCMSNSAKPEEKTSKPQLKTKVIVCKDNFVQTDFNDELARLTLAEKPNTLFTNDQTLQDADSDSGYSSPLHRKNQTSTAIQSSPCTYNHQPTPSHVPTASNPAPNVIVQTSHQSGTFQAFPNPVFPYALPPTYQIHQFPGVGYPPPMQFCGPRPMLFCNRPEMNPHGFVIVDGVRNRPRFRGRKKTEYAPTDMRPPGEGNPNVSNWKSVSTSVAEAMPGKAAAAANAAGSAVYLSGDRDVRLPFEDEDEFPILLSAAGGLVAQGECFRSSSLTYGEIVRSPSTQLTPRSRQSSASSSDKRKSNSLPKNITLGSMTAGLAINKDSKSVRKKQKRQLLAQQAAEEELAEISLEQQMLRELSTKQLKKQLINVTEKLPVMPVPSPVQSNSVSETVQTVATSSAVSHSMTAPSLFNIMDVVGQLEETKAEDGSDELQDTSKFSGSALDSVTASKRSKDREVLNNKKKPSSLKRVILKEREAKNRHNLLDNCSTSILPDGTVALVNNESSQPDCTGLVEPFAPPTLMSAEMSPVSQMSPINMSPLSGSPAGSAGASPIAGDGTLGSGKSSVLSKIHSRRFREYCNQVLDKEIDDCCTELLQDLVRFQDLLYHDDPTKAKSKRRFVLGLREVTKHLKLGKLKCVIISPNLERIQSKGGLDEALNAIIEMSQKQDVPFVFALGRRALGRACAKLVPVSVVGVFSYDGCEEHFFKLRDLTQKAREAYLEMVASLEQEMANVEPPATSTIATSAGSFEKLFPHLGHSRTPSACSAISFISSILSEPISENYPQSEPETDSRGYEIRHENRKPDLDTVGEGREETVEADGEEKNTTLTKETFDDGHEADTEEDGHYSREAFNNKTNSGARDLKERSKAAAESELHLSSASKLEPAATAPVSADMSKADKTCCLLENGTKDPGSKDSSSKDPVAVPVQTPMSTSEKSDRIESWVAESQRVTNQFRKLSSSESASATANADEDSEDGREEEEDDGDDAEEMDDAASLKTVEDSSSSEYEETTDVPFDNAQ